MIDPAPTPEEHLAAASSLRTFVRLPIVQRSAVILKDVLGYSIEEIGGIIAASMPAVKAALHRGRARLRELAGEPDDRPSPALSGSERARLAAYAERFNARDFDAVRDMLAEDVRLELVARTRMRGRQVHTYFGNYASVDDWRLVKSRGGQRSWCTTQASRRRGRPISSCWSGIAASWSHPRFPPCALCGRGRGDGGRVFGLNAIKRG